MTDPVRDPIPPLARDVVDLYRDALAEVRFPDVDAAALRHAERALLDAQCALEDAEGQLETARAAVAERSAAVTEQSAAVAEASAALASKVERALSYARVFAEGDPALHERVESIAARRAPLRSQGRTESRRSSRAEASVEAAPIKRRGRGRKSSPDDAVSLFEAPESAPIDLAS